MLALFVALEQEARHLKNNMRIENARRYRDYSLWEGRSGSHETLLVLTGSGPERARLAAARVLEEYRLQYVFSSGFAGALDDRAAAGDVVVYTSLTREIMGNAAGGQEKVLACDGGLVKLALGCVVNSTLKVFPGKGLTLERICAGPAEKYGLGRQYRAAAVDMESYVIGQAALEKGAPFLAFRSIFDEAGDDLSFLAGIPAGHGSGFLKTLAYVAGRPGDWKDLKLYYNRYRRAGRNLAAFWQRLVVKL